MLYFRDCAISGLKDVCTVASAVAVAATVASMLSCDYRLLVQLPMTSQRQAEASDCDLHSRLATSRRTRDTLPPAGSQFAPNCCCCCDLLLLQVVVVAALVGLD